MSKPILFVKANCQSFLDAGLNPDNIVWYAGLHESTESKHIHISFFEKEPTYFANGGKLTFYTGTIKKKVLLESKFIFEKKLTNATSQIVKARKDLCEKYGLHLSPFELNKKAKRLLLDLYKELPTTGRLSYDSENMSFLKDRVDDVTEFILFNNKQTQESYLNFCDELRKLQEWEKQRYEDEGMSYHEGMFRRFGNKTIQTALELGKLHDEIEKIQIYNRKEKIMQKANAKT